MHPSNTVSVTKRARKRGFTKRKLIICNFIIVPFDIFVVCKLTFVSAHLLEILESWRRHSEFIFKEFNGDLTGIHASSRTAQGKLMIHSNEKL